MVKYFRKGRLSRDKPEQLIDSFTAGSPARCKGDLLGINPKKHRHIIFAVDGKLLLTN